LLKLREVYPAGHRLEHKTLLPQQRVPSLEGTGLESRGTTLIPRHIGALFKASFLPRKDPV